MKTRLPPPGRRRRGLRSEGRSFGGDRGLRRFYVCARSPALSPRIAAPRVSLAASLRARARRRRRSRHAVHRSLPRRSPACPRRRLRRLHDGRPRLRQPAPPAHGAAAASVTPPVSTWRPPMLQVQGAEQPVRLAVAAGRRRGRRRRRRDARADGLLQPEQPHPRRQAPVPARARQVVSGFAARRRRAPARRRAGREGARAAGVRGHRAAPRRPGPAADDDRQQLRAARLSASRRARRGPSSCASSSRRRGPAAGAARLRRAGRRASRCRCAFPAPRRRARAGRRASRSACASSATANGGFVARSTRPRRRRCRRSRSRCACRRSARARRSPPRSATGRRYFTARAAGRRSAARRGRCRSRVQLVWDASGSGVAAPDRPRARPARCLLLARCATRQRQPRARRRRRRRADRASTFAAATGRPCARALETTVYDGASNLGAVRHDGQSRTKRSGSATASRPTARRGASPSRCRCTRSAARRAATRRRCRRSPTRAAAAASTSRSVSREGGRRRAAPRGSDARVGRRARVGARELVVQSQSAAAGRLVVAGGLTDRDGRGRRCACATPPARLTTRVVPVRAGRNPSRLAAVQWARLTLASLEGEARTNKVRIREIGKRFGLATRETSLIVLELVDDYVRHEIEPPAELRAAYDRAAANVGQAPRRERRRAAGAGGPPLRGARRLVEPRLPEGRHAGAARRSPSRKRRRTRSAR